MAIKSRSSDTYLHSSVILNKISEYDIFKYYCPQFEKLGKKFCSPLRKDSKPTVSIIQFRNRLLYKDFGQPEHTFDCFSFVSHKYECDFFSALRIVDMDFNLNLASHIEVRKFTMGYLGVKYNKQIEPKKVTIIKKKRRPWNQQDAHFWGQFCISKFTLEYFNVEPISHYWINENRFHCNEITYAYKYRSKYKIYSPNSEVKWMSNTTAKQIQGWEQLKADFHTKYVIITSSLKDVMCLYDMGHPAIALQSEMQMPDEKLIKDLKNKYECIILLYDNDFDNPNNPGQTMANKIKERYYSEHVQNICIDISYKSKDISDLIKNHGIKKAIHFMEKMIENKLKDYEKSETLPF